MFCWGLRLICFICLEFKGLNLESVVLINRYGHFDPRGDIKVGMSCLCKIVFVHMLCVVAFYPLRIQESK